MGAVYRASDRLTGGSVALKRVTTPAAQLTFASRAGKTDPRLALAQEFRILASLHHPNIIRVLDYGFDEQRCPFFTMTLLENAQTIVEAGRGQDVKTQVDLLSQALQALAYLHRRNILHRDLKPENVLAIDGQVQILDFGVSVTTSQTMKYLTQTAVGTLTYMAPELFRGEAVTQASDLYAVGVIAYELFAGRYPYNDANVAVLLSDVLTKPVDVRTSGVSAELATVLERLLVKCAEERYSDAEEVIRALCTATGYPLPPETAEIRESYLQAARFVGRERELGILSGAMEDALVGQGSGWLVGGESGVGKSRLVDELRTLALVRGAFVLKGQAIREGGSLYHLWRDSVRRLVLTTGLTEDEASVLKPLVPGIADLVGYDVPDAPSLEPQANQTRLLRVVGEMFERQGQPTVAILEDLHWAGTESLAVLDRLARSVAAKPLLLIGTYRDDERPHLPEALPGIQVLKLGRLGVQGIAELSESMLGQAGCREQVVDLLQRETEGNPFFLVQVVRALAEEAGRLEEIGRTSLPPRVFAEGVQEVIRRRLNRVPAAAGPLLQLAAVAGRELDLDLLHALAPEVDVSAWLGSCSSVAVLEVGSEGWRFAHNRLRAGVLDALSEDVRPGLHRRVAETLEACFPTRAEREPELLAYHYDRGRTWHKAFHYRRLAGTQAAEGYANQQATAHLRRALQIAAGLTPDRLALAQVHLALGKVLQTTGHFDAAIEHLEQAHGLLAETGTEEAARLAARACYEVGYTYELKGGEGNLEHALSWQAKGLALIPAPETAEGAWLHALGGLVRFRQARFGEAVVAGQQALRLAQAAGAPLPQGSSHRLLSMAYRAQGDLALAMEHCQRGIELSQEIGDLLGLVRGYSNRGVYAFEADDWRLAESSYLQAIELLERVGDRFELGKACVNLGDLYQHRGEIDAGLAYAKRGLAVFGEIGSMAGTIVARAVLATLLWRQGAYDEARRQLSEASWLARSVPEFKPTVGRWLAQVYLSEGKIALAEAKVRALLGMDLEVLEDEAEPIQILHGQILAAKGRGGEAREVLEESLRRLEARGARYQAGQAQLALGHVLASSEGCEEEAGARVERAREIFADLGARLEVGAAEGLLGHFS